LFFWSSISEIKISYTSFKNNSFVIYFFCDIIRNIYDLLRKLKGNKVHLIDFAWMTTIDCEKSLLAYETGMTVT
jgi:hypothetical protein